MLKQVTKKASSSIVFDHEQVLGSWLVDRGYTNDGWSFDQGSKVTTHCIIYWVADHS
jgi:hypothetical protein